MIKVWPASGSICCKWFCWCGFAASFPVISLALFWNINVDVAVVQYSPWLTGQNRYKRMFICKPHSRFCCVNSTKTCRTERLLCQSRRCFIMYVSMFLIAHGPAHGQRCVQKTIRPSMANIPLEEKKKCLCKTVFVTVADRLQYSGWMWPVNVNYRCYYCCLY